MNKLSKLYRNDSTEGLDDEMRLFLDKNYFEKLKNIHVRNPKILVIFSGGNAVGKTTLAKKIERELKGLVLENDEIKRVILQKIPNINKNIELNKLTWQYSMNLYSRLDTLTPNGLVVRDGIIDWYYDKILPIFEQKEYKLFIIEFSTSYEKAKELVIKRGDTPTVSVTQLLKQLEDHHIHQKRFRNKYKSDVILSDDSIFDHDRVINVLGEYIKKLGVNYS